MGTSVECCVNLDCVRDQVCDIATYTCKGGTILPVCGDGKVDAGEQCDDGNLISGDGCTSTCENEVEYCVSHPEDPVCIKEVKCAWYDLPCKIKKLFAGVTTFFMTLKYILVAIGSLFFFLFGKNILERIIKKKDKTSIYAIWTISILLGGLVGYILYTILFSWYFWLVLIGLIALNFFIKLVPLPKIRRRR